MKFFRRFVQCTEVHFAIFLSGEFITAIIVNPLERKLAESTSVQRSIFSMAFLLLRLNGNNTDDDETTERSHTIKTANLQKKCMMILSFEIVSVMK